MNWRPDERTENAMRISKRSIRPRSGIALFILLTSLIVISFGMSELFLSSNTQASRVRNYADRLQAIYIGRSTQSLARALMLLDASQKKYATSAVQADTLLDLWAQPIPFPVPTEMVQLLTQKALGEKEQSNQEKDEMKAFFKKCDSFFGDFHGDAEAHIEDLNALVSLNALDTNDPFNDTFEVLKNILKPNYEFERSLSSRNIDPETVAREIRDYIDKDDVEAVTKGPEIASYTGAQLNYGPKNSAMAVIDELKLIPSMDDELYDYLTHYVTGAYFPAAGRRVPAKINLNTVGKNIFQALLINISNPDQIAANFIKHRKEKKFAYTDANFIAALKDNVGLEPENFRKNLLTGVSDAFKIVTDVTVNQIKIRLEANVPRTPGKVQTDPVTLLRVSP